MRSSPSNETDETERDVDNGELATLLALVAARVEEANEAEAPGVGLYAVVGERVKRSERARYMAAKDVLTGCGFYVASTRAESLASVARAIAAVEARG